jgi:hypothetical protein
MSQLRLRIELNKGGVGMSFHKLAQISLETELFLRMFISDVDKSIVGAWVAKDFENNSVDFTAELVGNITPEQAQVCKQLLMHTMSEDLDISVLDNRVSRATLLQYAKIGKHIDPDEAVYFRLFDSNKKKPSKKPLVLTKEHSIDIAQRLKLTDTFQFQGSVQGVITALFKDRTLHSKPHFRLRELYSDNLIPCYYSYDLYETIIDALENKDAVVHVSGYVLASRNERKPLQITVKRLATAEPYREGDLERFIGCSPNATGDRSTEEFIDLIRNRREEELSGNSEEIT